MGYENLVGNQLLTRLSYFEDVGGFDTNFPAWQDYDLWYRIIMKFGPCIKTNEATYVMDVEMIEKEYQHQVRPILDIDHLLKNILKH